MTRLPTARPGPELASVSRAGHHRPKAVFATTVPVTLRTFYKSTIAHLQQQGIDVRVVSSPGGDLDRVASEAGCSAEAIAMSRAITPLADLRSLMLWIRTLRRWRPEAIYACTPKCALLAMFAGALVRVPRRVYICGGLRLEGEKGLRRMMLAAMERLTMTAATDVVVNSSSLREEVLERKLAPAAKVRQTQPGSSHGVDTNWFHPQRGDDTLRQDLGLTTSEPVIGFVGRLTKDKGIDTLVEAVRIVRAAGKTVQLLVIGPQDEPDSAAYAQKLSVSDIGAVVVGAQADVRPYFALMDLHVLPSVREGFPNVVLEAAAMGVPTITTTATGCRDSVLPGETGVLFPTGDSAALARELLQLLGDHERRSHMGKAAREWVITQFQPSEIAAQLVGNVSREGSAAGS